MQGFHEEENEKNRNNQFRTISRKDIELVSDKHCVALHTASRYEKNTVKMEPCPHAIF